jgi:hypothetical protein
MNSFAPSQPITAQALLFDNTDLASALQDSGVGDTVGNELRGFAQATRDEAIHELGAISSELLELDLGQVLLDAWSKHSELRAAGQRTAAAPESEELVELLSHRVTLEDRPSIDLLANGRRVAELHLAIVITIDVEALTATVRGGRLTGLRVGRCDADASLSIEDKTLARRRAQLELPFSVHMGSGIALVEGSIPSPRVAAVRAQGDDDHQSRS